MIYTKLTVFPETGYTSVKVGFDDNDEGFIGFDDLMKGLLLWVLMILPKLEKQQPR